MFEKVYAAGWIGIPAASTAAVRMDRLYDFLVWLSLILLGGTMLVMIAFLIRYHRSRTGRNTAFIEENKRLEIIWTVIPLILMLTVFVWGYTEYTSLRKDLPDPLEVNVVGRQWRWDFEYSNGRRTVNEIYLPQGRPVKLILSSEDVIHSFYVPNFRLKQDAVPGLYTSLSFVPVQNGRHPIYCAEFCGAGHSDMLGTVVVVDPPAFDQWLKTGSVAGRAPSLVAQGRKLYEEKACSSCHSIDGTRGIGPTFKGKWGSHVQLSTGSSVRFDENYVRESLENPNAKIVRGFSPQMPTYKGQLTTEEINAINAFIRSVK